MTILGNILLSLAALVYLLPLQLVWHETPRRNDGGGLLWATIFVLVPLGLLLTTAMCAVTARGGLDWLARPRGLQYPLVLAGGLALTLVSAFSLFGKFESSGQMPVSVRWLAGWGVQVLPLVVMAFGLLALNPGLGKWVPALVVRLPLMVVGGVSLLLSAGLLVEWFFHSQKQAEARLASEIEFHNQRDRDILARVETIKTEEDFPELLGFANRYEKEHIRSLAIRKAEAHPRFAARLAEVLASDWAEKGLVYLDACETADPRALAEPVRLAILELAGEARSSVERTHTLYAEQFDWNTRLILSVADKFHDHGVDYAPAIREFRAALDSPRGKDFDFHARRPLDGWLASHKRP